MPSPVAARRGRILVVDDQRANVEMLVELLKSRGYDVASAYDGEGALAHIAAHGVDLVISDIRMPGMDGYELTQRLRNDPATELLPVVLVTSVEDKSGHDERVKGIESGADDFLAKPVRYAELFARVRSLLRVKVLQDEVRRQATELRDWNERLEQRVKDQVAAIDRLAQMKRFFSPPVADAIVAGGAGMLEPHRREITAVFLDLRGFTAFTDRADPDQVMDLLSDYHVAMGNLVDRYGGTLEHFAGDGVMIFFNDPIPVDGPALKAVRMAFDLQRAFQPIASTWEHRGHKVSLGVGIAQGEATLGVIGFEQRWEYAAIGSVPNLAARLCGQAQGGEILIDAVTCTNVADLVEVAPVGNLQLRGFTQPMQAFRVVRVK
ncbi:MAG TPA: response regulator [Burkholderiales bacterium]|nr:response regulator [Burkholderiales bacterium]